MSTYWGFVCESHDPPLVSEHWFNHGEATLIDAYRKVRAGQWPTNPRQEFMPDGWERDPAPVDHLGYATVEPILWLREHPRCKVALANEYGATREIPAEGTDA